MIQKIAKLISGASSPFLTIPFFGLWSIASIAQSSREFLIWGGLFLVLLTIAPLLYVLIGMRMGFIDDLHVTLREQRPGVFLVSALAAVLLLAVYMWLGVPDQLLALTYAILVCGILFGVITFFWKISGHAGSYAGGVVIATMLVDERAAWLIFLLPAIIWSRITRNRHTIAQSLVAAILVVIAIYLTLLIA